MTTLKLFPEVKKIKVKSTVKFHLEVLSQVSYYHHHHHLFFIPWIHTGLQNPYGYYVPVSTNAFCSTVSYARLEPPIMWDIKSDTYIKQQAYCKLCAGGWQTGGWKFWTEW